MRAPLLRLARLVTSAGEASASHPYLMRKGVAPYGLKQTAKPAALVVPLLNADGEVVNVQFIDANGNKRFKAGGEVTGGSYCFGGEPRDDGVVMIGEGYATCASAYAATGHPVVVAFNAGNLLPVARVCRAKLPHAKIMMLADDDHRTEGNPGLTKARAAAHTVGGVVAVPVFGEGRADDATDFNDLQQHAGPEAVAACIEAPPGDGTGRSGTHTAATASAVVTHADGCAGPAVVDPSLLRLSLDASTLMSSLAHERKDIERALAFCATRPLKCPPPAAESP